jgi:2-isopropylmalate synthase
MEQGASDLIFDWNTAGPRILPTPQRIELDDETLRDGLQSPSVRTPSLDDKLALLHRMDELGIDTANIGLPGAGPHVAVDVRRLAREISDQKMRIAANCAARTLAVDINPIAEASQHAGIPIEACVFLGSSPIRQYAEDWTIDTMLQHTESAVSYAVSLGLPVMYVTEDTTRARPETLNKLYTLAIECGAGRICLCDTVGHATPEGAHNLVTWARDLVGRFDHPVMVDWHGHNDRGLGVVNTLAAVYAGADRVHATALGIGERVGNAAMDQLLINLRLSHWLESDLSALAAYCELAAAMTGTAIPPSYPAMGRDAFRTGTGVHAAAIIKAIKKGDTGLANLVYSGVPADYFGRHQIIELGPMSGQSNVIFWLEERDVEPTKDLVEDLFAACKKADKVLTEEAAQTIVRQHQGRPGHSAVSQGKSPAKVGERFLSALTTQNWDALESCLAPDIKFRAFIPSGIREGQDAATTSGHFRRWFGDADEIVVAASDIRDMQKRLSITYRLRVHEDQWYIVEQRAYCDVNDGRVERIDLLCSGFIPEAPTDTV